MSSQAHQNPDRFWEFAIICCALPLICALLCLLLIATAVSAQTTVTVTRPAGFAVSPRLSDIQDSESPHPPIARPDYPLPNRGNAGNPPRHGDLALQTTMGPLVKGKPPDPFSRRGCQ